jgi:pimeloyl-ACP methyl ester carboxylesterase
MIGAADPLEMAARLRGAAAAGSLRGRLRDLRQPLLVVWAEAEVPDRPLPFPDRTRVVVVPGIDHVGVMEHPDLVLPDLRGVLAAVDASSTWP